MNTNIELAKRAVACPGFYPTRGMRAFDVEHDDWVTVIEGYKGAKSVLVVALRPGVALAKSLVWRLAADLLPDLDDAGTLGCMENGLLPELYGCEVSVCFWHDTWWLVRHNDSHTMRSLGWLKCKSEALVAALEAAPVKVAQG